MSALPVKASVRDLLQDLLGRSVTVEEGAAQTLESPALAAVYGPNDGAPAAVAISDLPFASAAAGALGSMPATALEEQVGAGELDEDVSEHFRRVADAMAKLLNSPTTPNVALKEVHQVPGEVPADVAGVVLEPRVRVDFVVDVDGYGPGTLTFVAV